MAGEARRLPLPGQGVPGPEEIAAYFEETFVAIPDRRLEIIAMVEDGEQVLMRFHLSGSP